MLLPVVAPMNGQDIGNLLRALTDVRNDLANLGSGDAAKVLLDYQRWAGTSAQMLGYAFDHPALDQLVLTRRHWWLMDAVVIENAPAVLDAFRAEQTDRVRVFDELIAKYRQIEARWTHSSDTFVVPDTNFFIHHEVAFNEADWETIGHRTRGHKIRVVVPIAVVRELDRLKINGKNAKVGKPLEDLRTRARRTLRTLESMFTNPAGPMA